MIWIIPCRVWMLYPTGMKPTAPETGTIIRIEGENAVIMMKGTNPARVAVLDLKPGETKR
jgi:hypothetical protein